MKPSYPSRNAETRRAFLAGAAVAAAGATLTSLTPPVHAAGSDILRIGLIGCGNRGTGAAEQALRADKNTKLVAMGDMFADKLEKSLSHLKRTAAIADRVAIKPDNSFTGFDAYKSVIELSDVVLLTTPPHFRPLHLKAAVDAGKHIFAEKPCAVDALGVRAVLKAAEEATKKNLTLVAGLCWRYHHGMRETMKRVYDGSIGAIAALQCTYNTGGLWSVKRLPGWSDMEWQLRNWLYFTWLSGDFNVEQHIHSIDKMAWAMQNEYPVRAVGSGGRQVRTDPLYGNIFDHHTVVYEYANGVKLFSACRQQVGCAHDVSDHIMGSKATCHIETSSPARGIITDGKKKIWQSVPGGRKAPHDDMYQNEHDELFASIRTGKPINNGEWMAKSTLMAIMGRMATYTGQVIEWDKALASKEDLTPPAYAFGSLPVAPIARPGVTKFI
ncbi:MAG TPA: Gfo/Idh/MocA family oxidoreductase [Gemmataceae bacterium]|nr:Gfo/Idh/MocA family oxidoreductase [Gemmataceae bacterium]